MHVIVYLYVWINFNFCVYIWKEMLVDEFYATFQVPTNTLMKLHQLLFLDKMTNSTKIYIWQYFGFEFK
jgi:hypothetical protein